MKYETLKILKEEKYRNQPYVNISDNMVRVTLTCSINEWHNIKRHLTNRSIGLETCGDYHELKKQKDGRMVCNKCGLTFPTA